MILLKDASCLVGSTLSTLLKINILKYFSFLCVRYNIYHYKCNFLLYDKVSVIIRFVKWKNNNYLVLWPKKKTHLTKQYTDYCSHVFAHSCNYSVKKLLGNNLYHTYAKQINTNIKHFKEVELRCNLTLSGHSKILLIIQVQLNFSPKNIFIQTCSTDYNSLRIMLLYHTKSYQTQSVNPNPIKMLLILRQKQRMTFLLNNFHQSINSNQQKNNHLKRI